MTATLIIIAVFSLVAAAVGLTRRDLIHAALCLALAWGGIAAFYLWADAEFLAFAQALIYLGAISMVVLFAVLLTRRVPQPGSSSAPSEKPPRPGSTDSNRIAAGLMVGGLVAGLLGFAVVSAPAAGETTTARRLTVGELGRQLMERHAGALLVAGVILTVALIGAVVIAAAEVDGGPEEAP